MDARSTNGRSGPNALTITGLIVSLAARLPHQCKDRQGLNMDERNNNGERKQDKSANSEADFPARKKRGRPKGSKNKRHECVAVLPARCVHCDSSELIVEQTVKTRKIVGAMNGVKYDTVIWRDCRCKACGRINRYRYYESKTS